MNKNHKSEVVDEWPSYLNENILNTINNTLKFTKMTPVQSVVIPIFMLKHKDVVVEAVTGSGKTLAFVVPLLELLLKRQEKLKKHDIGALIISPTRELAIQTYEIVELFLQNLTQFTTILFVGGTNPSDDFKNFQSKGGNIVVCTAGRFEDLLNRKVESLNLATHLKALEVLILDEADRLLDLGFSASLNTIFNYLPKQRRTGLFSATQTNEIDKLVKAGLRNPCCIQVKQNQSMEQKTPVTLNNYYLVIDNEEHKFYCLIKLLQKYPNSKHLIFMSTCACVQYFDRLLNVVLKNTKILSLHRKLKDKRNKVFNEFKKLKKGILLCTDVLSRGIDINNVDWVIQYDLPKSSSSFVHRCGRTARLERIGNAIVFLLPNEDCYVDFIKLNQNVPLDPYTELTDINESESNEIFKKIQKLASTERELYEKGKEAFVSYVQSYTKHECSHILRVKELDFAKLAKSFGLLHLPKMPEIKKKLEYESLDMDYSTIPYKEKHKEGERLKKLENGAAAKKTQKFKPKQTVAWSMKKEKKLKRKIKREKKHIVEDKKRKLVDDDDLNELQEDFKLLKKLKRKKITETEFEEKFINE